MVKILFIDVLHQKIYANEDVEAPAGWTGLKHLNVTDAENVAIGLRLTYGQASQEQRFPITRLIDAITKCGIAEAVDAVDRVSTASPELWELMKTAYYKNYDRN